jgi:hypothetical protein
MYCNLNIVQVVMETTFATKFVNAPYSKMNCRKTLRQPLLHVSTHCSSGLLLKELFKFLLAPC